MRSMALQLHTRRSRAQTAVLDARGPTGATLSFILLATLALLVVSYLVLLNAMTQKTFELKKLDGKLTELRRDNKRYEVNLAREESIANLAERVSGLGMVPSDRAEYVTVGAAAVALR